MQREAEVRHKATKIELGNRVAYLEAEGKPLPQFDGCHVVPEGAVLLASTQPKSLDGRYFGMTPMAELTAQAVPLWVWR